MSVCADRALGDEVLEELDVGLALEAVGILYNDIKIILLFIVYIVCTHTIYIYIYIYIYI